MLKMPQIQRENILQRPIPTKIDIQMSAIKGTAWDTFYIGSSTSSKIVRLLKLLLLNLASEFVYVCVE